MATSASIWPVSSADRAAWVQAFGAVTALAVAVGLAAWERRRARAQRRVEQFELLDAAISAAANARGLMNSARKRLCDPMQAHVYLREQANPAAIAETASILREIPVGRLGDREASSALMKLRMAVAYFQRAIESAQALPGLVSR